MYYLPHPSARTRTHQRSALVLMAFVAMLLMAWNLLGQAGGNAHTSIAARSMAAVIAVGITPGGGSPSENLHHPVERKKPRQLELTVASQLDATDLARASSAGIAWIAGTAAPVADASSTLCIADTTELPPASADAGQLRLHPSQAPPSA